MSSDPPPPDHNDSNHPCPRLVRHIFCPYACLLRRLAELLGPTSLQILYQRKLHPPHSEHPRQRQRRQTLGGFLWKFFFRLGAAPELLLGRLCQLLGRLSTLQLSKQRLGVRDVESPRQQQRRPQVSFTDWCDQHFLLLNVKKTKK